MSVLFWPKFEFDVVVDGKKDRRKGNRFERSVKTADDVGGRHDVAFHRLFGIIRIFGTVGEGHGIPGIALAPFERLLADIDFKIRRFGRCVCFVEGGSLPKRAQNRCIEIGIEPGEDPEEALS